MPKKELKKVETKKRGKKSDSIREVLNIGGIIRITSDKYCFRVELDGENDRFYGLDSPELALQTILRYMTVKKMEEERKTLENLTKAWNNSYKEIIDLIASTDGLK